MCSDVKTHFTMKVHGFALHYMLTNKNSLFYTRPSIKATLDPQHLVTVKKYLTEDVPMMESILLILVVPIKNHFKSIAPVSTLSSRGEWMDLRISIEVGVTMFRALAESAENTGLDWTRSIASLQALPELN